MGVREGGWDKGTELGAQHNLLPNLWQLPEICFVREERKEVERGETDPELLRILTYRVFD